ncbi:MAG: hypothetical protein PUG98_01250, partial [Clostridium sp.]|nr:hypothetical protein [Clostridium sp.]
MNKQKTRKKVVAFLLSMLMLISLFQNISYTPIAEGGETETTVETAAEGGETEATVETAAEEAQTTEEETSETETTTEEEYPAQNIGVSTEPETETTEAEATENTEEIQQPLTL